LWGINNGYLKVKDYLPTAMKGWNYLTTFALQSDGKLGYVQPIGERAIPGQVVDKNLPPPLEWEPFYWPPKKCTIWPSKHQSKL
jgi:hypothetical protein